MTEVDQRRWHRSSTIAGVGDGVIAVALPLVTIGITRDPLAVAAVVAAQYVPWVVVAAGWPMLGADRRTIVGAIDTFRAVAIGLLALFSLVGAERLTHLLLVAGVIGLGEALTDGAEAEAVSTEATSLQAGGMVGLAVIGLPLGGALFEVFPATPLLFNIGVFAVAALFALAVGHPIRSVAAEPGSAATARLRLASLAPSPGTGPLVAAAVLASMASSAVLGVLVLFAVDDLGLGAPSFGVLLATLALAGAAGAAIAPTVGGAMGIRTGLAISFVGAGVAYLVAARLAGPESPLPAAVALGVATAGTMLGGVLLRALLARHRPDLAGFHCLVWAAIPVGALAGGLVAETLGVADTVAGAGALLILAAPLAALVLENNLTGPGPAWSDAGVNPRPLSKTG